MKICTSCERLLPVDMFYKMAKSKDGLQGICKVCRKAIDAESYAKNPLRKDAIKARNNAERYRNVAFLYRYKRLCGCRLCTEKEPVALDLHHVDAATKDADPSKLVAWSKGKLKTEIRKCVVLCANCHRKVHAGIVKLPG